MRLVNLLFMLVLVTMISCNNEFDSLNQLSKETNVRSMQSQSVDTTDVLVISSAADIIRIMGPLSFVEYQNPTNLVMTKSNFTVDTFIGCDSYAPRSGLENKTVSFNATQAEQWGFQPYVYYVADFCEAKVTINIPSTVSPIIQNSPECGFKPGAAEGSRGYSSILDNNKFVMTTYLTHIKSNMAGSSVDRWIPCSPQNLKWIYGIIAF
ncbi:hypothetical protein [Parabacteroides goldsteinii]|uniref:hypothetical protein n=1 Tax=Parabacteroides goldsteinii TaxID=328812 RepID=UPI002431EB15|nr:hypothetical protein [Parabacteroides goldsteinii]